MSYDEYTQKWYPKRGSQLGGNTTSYRLPKKQQKKHKRMSVSPWGSTKKRRSLIW